MSGVVVDFRLVVVDGLRSSGIKGSELDALLKTPVFRPTEPPVVTPKSSYKKKEDDETEVSPQEVIEAANAGQDLAEKILQVIRDRSKDIVMKVDPVEEVNLYRACSAIIKDFSGSVTFGIFEKVVEYNKEIMLAAAKAEGALVGDEV